MPTIDIRAVIPEIPSDVLSPIADVWATDLKAAQYKIYGRAVTKIPDIDKYREFIAYMSYTKWYNFVNPSFPKAEYITLKQKVKVLRGGLYWHTNFYTAMYSYFPERVDTKKTKYAENALEVLRTNRPRYLGWGIAEVIALGLTGDLRAKLYLDEMLKNSTIAQYITVNAFEPDVYVKLEYANLIRPAIIDLITQGAIFSIFAYQGTNDDNTASQVLSGFSAMFNDLISKHLAEGVTLTTAALEWDTTFHRPAVHVVVSK